MKVLLFTGAGASVELGVPAMRPMVQDLHNHLRGQGIAEEVFGRFDAMLNDVDYDVEKLIESIDGLERGEWEKQDLGFDFDEKLLSAVKVMRWECEWFIHELCERVRAIEASALWRPTLQRRAEHEICFVTTNYDRAIEFGCAGLGIKYDDGFCDFVGREYAEWTGISDESALKILKIHGSTDWYQGVDGEVYKLKHAIPLYGEFSLSNNGPGMPRLTSAMVLPTREKKVNQPPYPDLVTDFRNAARSADVAVFVGTSLRDPDILDIFRQCSNRIPTYTVGLGVANRGSGENAEAKAIFQTTSEFTISTLPRFLDESETQYLDEVARKNREESHCILPLVIMAQKKDQPAEKVCEAIEALAEFNVSLDFEFLKPLLMHESATVRNYALSVVPSSIDLSTGLELAEELAEREPSGTFAEELGMLKRLMKK